MMREEQIRRVETFLTEGRSRFDEKFGELCAADHPDIPKRLAEAMRYSLLAGGKRLRPLLCLAAAERCGVAFPDAFPLAAAIEMLHTASLIHDDLPSMDNDDLRRGKPTSHRKFGEPLALLAGDSLWLWPFDHVMENLSHLPAQRVIRALHTLTRAAGPWGVCGGQVLDTDRESQDSSPDFVYRIAMFKTASLIRAALVSGAQLGDVTPQRIEAYSEYGIHLGIAFQIRDDLLDRISTAEQMGKAVGKDRGMDKRTFVSAYGEERAQALVLEESAHAAAALSRIFPAGDVLMDLAEYLAERRT
jgi:geranylgeranyl diphosphate synthase type II